MTEWFTKDVYEMTDEEYEEYWQQVQQDILDAEEQMEKFND